MDANRFIGSAALGLVLGCGCGAGHGRTVALLKAGVPASAPPDAALEVVTKSTAIADPLPVAGASVEYADLEAALGQTVGSSALAWANEHGQKHPKGLQLSLELTQASAEYDNGRLKIALSVRATLRTRKDNVYRAQTNANCNQAGLVEPEDGGPVVFRCMTHIGEELAGWLSGLEK